ncbi:MAG: hypothetical protein ABF805_01300 [Bifidobacterium sp.]
MIIAIVATAALVLAGSVVYANHVRETQRQEALASCENQLKSFNSALTDLDKAKDGVADALAVTVEQVADGATVTALSLTAGFAAMLVDFGSGWM